MHINILVERAHFCNLDSIADRNSVTKSYKKITIQLLHEFNVLVITVRVVAELCAETWSRPEYMHVVLKARTRSYICQHCYTN
jgi:hypothetical protein